MNDLAHVLKLATLWAKKFYDGHFTLFKFTTEYKFVFGTPSHLKLGIIDLSSVQGYPTPEEAIYWAMIEDMERKP